TSNSILKNIRISVGIDDEQARRITIYSNDLTNQLISFDSNETKLIKIFVPLNPFQAGNFHFTIFASEDGNVSEWVMNAGSFEVENGDFFNTGRIVPVNKGHILVKHNFS